MSAAGGFEPPPFMLEAIGAATRPTQFERLCADMGIHPECAHVWSEWIDTGTCETRECYDCGIEEDR